MVPSDDSTVQTGLEPSACLLLLTPCSPDQIWCMGSSIGDNQTHHHINRTVDGSSMVAVLSGLTPSVLYQVEVAAVTSAGVGMRSQPVSILLSESRVSHMQNISNLFHLLF